MAFRQLNMIQNGHATLPTHQMYFVHILLPYAQRPQQKHIHTAKHKKEKQQEGELRNFFMLNILSI